MKTFLKYQGLVILLAISILSPANNNFEKEKWQDVVEGVDFTEDYKEKKPEKKEKTNVNMPALPAFGGGGLTVLSYVLLAIILGVAIYFIVRTLNSDAERDKKVSSVLRYDDDNLEENIHDLNLYDLLKQAINNQDFRSAIRIKFLITIRSLSDKAIIAWKKDKTNWEYHKEIEPQELKFHFSDLISYYEKVWYGNINLELDDFYKLEPFYDRFIDRI
ncbi:MAG: hypothetical protein MRY83_24745 [Flavobacteriales bacterium]|nr:hypothetical protein [Flavobacteriales bacterium]